MIEPPIDHCGGNGECNDDGDDGECNDDDTASISSSSSSSSCSDIVSFIRSSFVVVLLLFLLVVAFLILLFLFSLIGGLMKCSFLMSYQSSIFLYSRTFPSHFMNASWFFTFDQKRDEER